MDRTLHLTKDATVIEEVTDSLVQESKPSDNSFYDKYEPKEILGRGLCSVVRRCVEKSTQASYAVKIIDLTRKDNSEATQTREAGYNEIRLLRKASNHPCIIELHDVFETPAFLFLIFELCANGELFDLLTQKVRLSEKRSRHVMRQLLTAVAFLHAHNIMHRDIKCENILLDGQSNIRLSDFGFAAVYDENVIYKDLLGTPGYLSPEMLKANSYDNHPGYGLAVDMWACGVVFYTLIAGSPPFYHRKTIYMLRDIKNGKYSFPAIEWDDVNSECKDLIKQMLCVDPSQRITAKEALLHEFFQPKEIDRQKTTRSKVKCVFNSIRFLTRLKLLSKTLQPLSREALAGRPYRHKPLRQLIDAAAFNIYGHWVQRTEQQNRGALFELYNKPHPQPAVSKRHRLLSATHDSDS